MTGCYVGGKPKRNPGEHGTGLKTRHYLEFVRDDVVVMLVDPKRNPGEYGTGLKTRHYLDSVWTRHYLDFVGWRGGFGILRTWGAAVLRPYGIDARVLVDSVW